MRDYPKGYKSRREYRKFVRKQLWALERTVRLALKEAQAEQSFLPYWFSLDLKSARTTLRMMRYGVSVKRWGR
jgi:hypothetical protein